jgi:hypothetical protein
MDINHRLHDVEQSSTVYVHQAEKFHAEVTHVIINEIIKKLIIFLIFFILVIRTFRKIFC